MVYACDPIPSGNWGMGIGQEAMQRWRQAQAYCIQRNLAEEARAMKAPRNPWREVLHEALIVNCIYHEKHESDPLQALHDLIAFEIQIALDPAVSAEARALQESGKPLEGGGGAQSVEIDFNGSQPETGTERKVTMNRNEAESVAGLVALFIGRARDAERRADKATTRKYYGLSMREASVWYNAAMAARDVAQDLDPGVTIPDRLAEPVNPGAEELLTEEEVDDIFDRHQCAPAMSFRYHVARDIAKALALKSQAVKPD